MNSEKENWFIKVENHIKLHAEKNIKAKDVRFYNLGGFIEIAKKVELFSGNCNVCDAFKPEIEQISLSMDEVINSSVSSRRDFEKMRDEITRHLEKDHALSKRNINKATYGLIGMVLGALFGYFIGFVIEMIKPEYIKAAQTSMLIGWALGLIGGRFAGSLKDKKLKKEGLSY